MAMIHFVYRSSPDDHNKPRPSYFNKQNALATFLEAAAAVPNTMTYVVDGEIPADRYALMHSTGEVHQLPGLGNSRSYRCALSLLENCAWRDDDIVYFAEDDYYYVQGAFQVLLDASERIGEASFFSLYDHPDYDHLKVHRNYRASRRHWNLTGATWRPVRSTCLTFGARVGPFRQHSWLHYLATRSDTPKDFQVWSGLQRSRGYRLTGSLARQSGSSDLRIVKGSLKIDRKDSTLLVACKPSYASHMHFPYVTTDRDWAALAAG